MTSKVESVIRTAEIAGYARVSDLKIVKQEFIGLLAPILDAYDHLCNDIKTDVGFEELDRQLQRAESAMTRRGCHFCGGPLEYDRTMNDVCCSCSDKKHVKKAIHQFKHNQFSEE